MNPPYGIYRTIFVFRDSYGSFGAEVDTSDSTLITGAAIALFANFIVYFTVVGSGMKTCF